MSENDTNAQATSNASATPQYRYTTEMAQRIEKKWQDSWESEGTFWAANVSGELTDGKGSHADGRQSFFAMDMFPYPSGKGLHVGHPLGYLATDVVSRYHRMKGENVLHAMGYDAFGLPAEQYAVQTGQHPRITTEQNIANMRRQLRRMGLSFDDRRSFATIEPEYVRWTQWIFSRIYDAWYDSETRNPSGSMGCARPISTLIEQFRAGARPIDGHEGKAWDELTEVEQSEVLNEYRLAYISKSPVNWCPGLGTVLANEEVTAEGRSERGNFPVFQRELRQWSMRITAYGHRLIEDLDSIDWPEKVKLMQRNWIGESHGASVHFKVPVDGEMADMEIYTTRPDTLFGATFCVVSPEHPMLEHVPQSWPEGVDPAWTGGYATPSEAVSAYRELAEAKTAADRVADNGEKTGLFTGLYAINPITGAKLPVFTADYVLMDYGTGAIMAVPGGDQRDYDFAIKYGLPVIYTVAPLPDSGDDLANYEGTAPFVSHDGIVINSTVDATWARGDALCLDGMRVDDAIAVVTTWLEEAQVGKGATSYRLRDWLFSRQRYWGEPFPIVYDEHEVPHLVPDSMLPINLPDVPDYSPKTFDPEDSQSSPEAPLSRNEDWVKVTLDLGDGPKTYHHDTNTMPNWAGSCWYYMRYLNPHDTEHMVERDEYDYWMGPKHSLAAGQAGGVDLYVGGVEHAVLHLLYSRFWHKILFDLGYVDSFEPFHKLFNQGMIQAYAYTDDRGQYVPAEDVQESEVDGKTVYTYEGEPVNREFGKMGKSLKNIVTPDYMYDHYGADTFRLYEMSMGPLDESRPWNTRNVVGGMRFLQRLWRNVIDENTGEVTVTDDAMDERTLKLLNNTIAEVTGEMEAMRPNTAIAKLIVLNNHLTGMNGVPRAAVEPLVLMVAPIAPHIAEELWNRLGHGESLAHHPWPQADERYVGQDTVTAVVQIKGKVRAKLEVSADIDPDELEKMALEAVAERLGGKPPRKVIVKAPKIVSIVPGE
ncbi:leucine--tRNA ligase [Bifidobacterium animalis]|uniref:leucine--tRNA ligase n=1 Tax=Bifidobacterium animalis TaxID=28025 RepID=UPI00080C8841|nr:leucine--tRNA ligase [Bifidobacterium animalis]ANU43976.1 leucine--tRNA ligase [Bifidobacterium animalis subsp. animalis]PHQ54675.1 leucine--tRNA ligase [Bifidobacterium animalis subsp. animalis]QQQ90232.1 leucine--tRNA ligase [Bifidobacterium animalis]UQE63317.1 leucine--tRNA ligase [Bifidobacterium animalis]